MNIEREVNPFEDPVIARQWIASIEGEERKIRDKETYPMLTKWLKEVGGDTVLDIGSGQGAFVRCLPKDFTGTYYGVEPSETLTDRAIELYGENRYLSFLIGNAYALPLEDNSIDTAFSVNVWFHLRDLFSASRELSRVLKHGSFFHVSTANPFSYDVWETFYEDPVRKGKLLTGKVNIPVQPLDKNDFYLHSFAEIIETLEGHGLQIEETAFFGSSEKIPEEALFVSITGRKP